MLPDRDTHHMLLDAVHNGNLEKVRDIIRSVGLSSNSTSDGYVLLCDAIEYKQKEIAKLLLSEGAAVKSKNNTGNTPLHFAVLYEDKDLVELLLNRNSDVNYSDSNGRIPLHLAVTHGNEGICQLLLKKNSNPNVSDSNGYCPLHIVAMFGFLEIAKELIMHGACVNSSLTSSPEEGYTPLHFASRNENEGVVKFLIDNGAVINATAKNGLTPLHIAVQEKQLKIVPLLLGHGAEVDSKDKDGKTPLYFAAVGGCLAIIQDILKHRPNVSIKSNKLAFHSVIHKQKESAERFIDYGFRIGPEDANDSKLLQVSVDNGLTRIVEDLLHYGADINIPYEEKWKKGLTLLHSATRNGNKEIASLLINYGANVNAKDVVGRTPLYYAILGHYNEICRLLLANEVNVNDVFEEPETLSEYNVRVNSQGVLDGQTALHCATFYGNKEIAELLIHKGANVNAVTLYGFTALHIAVNGSNEEIVQLLLEHNANVNAMDKRTLSPLHLTCINKNVKIVKTLLEYGADVNCKNRMGETVLHQFCRLENLEGVKELLNYGADINATTRGGSTPLNIALSGINNSESYFSKSIDIAKHIVMHVVKMLDRKMFVSDKNLTFGTLSAVRSATCGTRWFNREYFLNFQNMCEKEIQEMKNQKIVGNLSFFDILIKNSNQLAAYERDESISQFFDSGEYIYNFPIYAEMLEMQVFRGKRRNELLECASIALHYCSKSFLPFKVIQKILLYLSEKDLITLTKFYQKNFVSSDANISK